MRTPENRDGGGGTGGGRGKGGWWGILKGVRRERKSYGVHDYSTTMLNIL